MRIGRLAWKTSALVAVASALCTAAFASGNGNAAQRAQLLSEYGKIPLNFEQNKGQADGRVKFLSRGSGYTLLLTGTEAILGVAKKNAAGEKSDAAVRMSFVGGNAAAVEGVDALAGKTNIMRGNDPRKFHLGIPHYAKVAYRGVYPGIDVVYYGNQRQLEYDFVVAPGADPNRIRIRFDGVRSVRAAADGSLRLDTGSGIIEQQKPVIYQEIGGERREVAGHYRVKGNEASFVVARYDARKPLVIDPVLSWTTYLGGSLGDQVTSVTTDGANFAYVTGSTNSLDFPALNQFFSQRGDNDVFVTKYNLNGASTVYSSIFGGSSSEQGTDVAVDKDGQAYVVGNTNSGNFPIVNPTLQNTLGGAQDAFVVKMNADGTIAWSTYLGGFNTESANAVALDSTGRPVIAGSTNSINYWVGNGYRSANNGLTDGFITKLAAAGGGLVWSSYFGSTGNDYINGVALDSADNVYVTGSTTSIGFPTTPGVFKPIISTLNVFDAFVSKFSAAGNALVYSTLIGGAGADEGVAIAVDSAMNAYVYGETESTDFITVTPVQAANRGNRDTFLVKVNPTATARVYATYLGGSQLDRAGEIVVDSTNSPIMVGTTYSPDLTVFDAVQSVPGGAGDVSIVQVTPAGNAYITSSYFGGVGEEAGNGVALDKSNNLYVAGSTTSFSLATAGSAQPAFVGVQDGFVSKFSNCRITITPGSRTRTHLPNGAPAAAGDTSTIVVTTTQADCAWIAVSDNPSFITITSGGSGAASGTVTYTVAANTGSPRTGSITVAGQRFTIEQQGPPPVGGGCIYPLEPTTQIAPGEGWNGTFRVPTLENCAWTATVENNVPWIQVFPTSGTGTTTVSYTVYPNFSSQIRNGRVLVNGQPFTIVQAPTLLSEPERFVVLMYFNFIGRYPTYPEITFHVGSLINGLTREQLAENFFRSGEFNLGGRFVAGLYKGLLGRDPEFGGWLFQRNALARGGFTREGLVANFLNSPEFGLKGVTTDESLVRLLYAQVLNRLPTADEVAFQVQQIQTQGRVAVAAAFLSVPEFQAGNDRRFTAYLLYATLLQRQPTEAEILTREGQLITVPLRTVIADFLASQEFQRQLQ